MADGAAPEAGSRRLRPVVLVGMPGAGKSTVGRRLATRLGRPFVDADDELVRRSGRTVREWFAAEGEEAFRRAESDLLLDLLAAPGPSVIAAGGGVVLAPANRAALVDGARVIHLRAGGPYLASRVGRKGHRPLLDDDPAEAIARLLAERTPLYEEVADIVVDVEPFRAAHERPKRVQAAHIAALVLSAEEAEEAKAAEDPGAPAAQTGRDR